MKTYTILSDTISKSVALAMKSWIFVLIGTAFIACSEEKNGPMGSDSTVPGLVQITENEPLPGGAKLSYKLPDDKKLLYVEATLQTKEGRKLDFRSSSYMTSVTILGLSSEREETVEIRSVSTSGVKSEPQLVKITPQKPPYLAVFESLSIEPDFGGVKLRFENDSKSELAYFLGYYDKDNRFVDYESHYTYDESGFYIYRGLESKETRFGLYIRDKWDNTSDTLEADITPYLEMVIPKDKFKAMKLVTDAESPIQWNVRMENLWDGYYSQDYNDPYYENGGAYGWLLFTFPDSPIIQPRYFTFDTGTLSKLTRIRLHHYFRYENSASRICEFYGRADEPPVDGSEEGWIKLCRMEQIRPSLSGGAISIGDAEAWEKGTEAIVDSEAPSVRYIRVKTIEDWAGLTNWSGTELFLFGQIVE